MSGDGDALRDYEAALEQGVAVAEFTARFKDTIAYVHGTGLTENYRLGRGRAKRLRDEVTPMIVFSETHASSDDKIQFPLNDGLIDCNIWHSNGQHRKVQITVAQARARLNLMQELNETGESHGFLALTDDRLTAEFKAAMNEDRYPYTTEAAQGTILRAIELALENKKGDKAADTLVIDAPLLSLPKERWEEMLPDMKDMASRYQFSEVFVVSSEGEHLCLRIL